jgi:hypothetical protein
MSAPFDRRRAIAIGIAGIMGGAGLVLLRQGRRSVDPEAVRRRASALGELHGIEIGYGPPQTFFVPPYTATDATLQGGSAVAAELDAIPRALDGIEAALSVYPPGFVKTLCHAIFVCGGLTLDGARAGGTFGPAWLILVAAQRLGEDGIFDTCRIGVHHELSSLVWRHLPELPLRWALLLPKGWVAARDNAEALAAATIEPEERDDGFLSAYGATTAENDFNVYAETAFDAPARLVAAADRSPLVASKAACLLQTYRRLDERFTAVFEKFGASRLLETRDADSSFAESFRPLQIPSGQITTP